MNEENGMTLQEMIQEAQKLSVEEREKLAQALQAMSLRSPQQTSNKYRLSDIRGLGADIWHDIDVQQYVDDSRDEWDNH